jgi:hypothetical protein
MAFIRDDSFKHAEQMCRVLKVRSPALVRPDPSLRLDGRDARPGSRIERRRVKRRASRSATASCMRGRVPRPVASHENKLPHLAPVLDSHTRTHGTAIYARQTHGHLCPATARSCSRSGRPFCLLQCLGLHRKITIYICVYPC